LLEELSSGQVTVREAEARSRSQKKGTRARSAEGRVLERKLHESLGMKVQILERGQAGKITIRYRTLDDFDRLYRLLTGEAPEV
jgi:hypothetical protein